MNRMKMRSVMAWAAVIFGAALAFGVIVIGCGGSPSGTGSTSGSTSGSTNGSANGSTSLGTVVLNLSNPSSLGGSTVVMSGTDANGRILFGPASFPLSELVSATGVPQSVAVFSVDILRADGHKIKTYTDEIDLSSGVVVITNPPFVSDVAVVYTFAVLGGMRLDKSDKEMFGNLDSVDQNQYLRNLSDLYGASAHPSPTCTPVPTTSTSPLPPSPLPARVFCTGDQVLALKTDTSDLMEQLADWNGYTEGAGLPSPSSSPSATSLNPNWQSRVVVMPGNHEMLEKLKTDNLDDDDSGSNKQEVPNPAAGPVFTTGMNNFIAASNGPTQADMADNIARDESMLSYYFTDTFTYQTISGTPGSETIGFVCLNTETLERDNQIGHVPVNWLRTTALPALSNCAHVFIFGHKPITAPDPKNQGSDSAINSKDEPGFLQALNGSGLVRAYLTGHMHLWQKPTTYSNWLPGAIFPIPQILLGSSGAPPDAGYTDACATAMHWKNPFSGFMLVRLHVDGSISVQAWGRPVASNGSSDTSSNYYAKPCCDRATVLRHQSKFYPWSQPPLCPPNSQ